MWYYLEDTCLQASKYKKFQLKQQFQAVKLGTKIIDEYIKEFKRIWNSRIAIHKSLDEDSKTINFDRGLGSKYKTRRTVMLGKPPYPTFNEVMKIGNLMDWIVHFGDLRVNLDANFESNHIFGLVGLWIVGIHPKFLPCGHRLTFVGFLEFD